MYVKQTAINLIAFTAIFVTGTTFANAMDDENSKQISRVSSSQLDQYNMEKEELKSEHVPFLYYERTEWAQKIRDDIDSALKTVSVSMMDKVLSEVLQGGRTLSPYDNQYLIELKTKRDIWILAQARKNLITAEKEESVEQMDAILFSLVGVPNTLENCAFYNSLLAKRDGMEVKKAAEAEDKQSQ